MITDLVFRIGSEAKWYQNPPKKPLTLSPKGQGKVRGFLFLRKSVF